MIEVFKTNVNEQRHAEILVEKIHKRFEGHEANFDLQDCDKILRIKCRSGVIQVSEFIHLLSEYGFHAEVLPDELQL